MKYDYNPYPDGILGDEAYIPHSALDEDFGFRKLEMPQSYPYEQLPLLYDPEDTIVGNIIATTRPVAGCVGKHHRVMRDSDSKVGTGMLIVAAVVMMLIGLGVITL